MAARASTQPHGPVGRLLSFAGKARALIYVGCTLSAVHAVLTVCMLVCVWLAARDLVAAAPDWSMAAGAQRYGWWALGCALIALVVYFCALMCTHLAAFRTATNMREAAAEHLGRVPLGYFDTHATGELRRAIEGSTGLTEGVLAHRLPDLVGALVTPVAFVVVAAAVDWALGLACLVPVAVAAWFMSRMFGGSKNADADYMTFMAHYQDALQDMNRAAVEYVRGIPVVKVFQQTVDSFRTFGKSIETYRRFATNYVKLCEGPQIAQLVAINATFAILVPVGIVMAHNAGDFAAFLTDFLFFAVFSAITTSMMGKVMYASQTFTEAADAVRRIDTILGEPAVSEPEGGRREQPRDASIAFEHVSFAYPGSDETVLNDVSLEIPAGSTVALVGPSGGGKTTAASLVPRFWDAGEGRVLVGGADVRRIPPEELMQNIAFVFQNERLFRATIAENIAAARPSATRAQIEEAAHAAQCDDIIAKLPQGLDTPVGPGGAHLSGGERQRIALARAILKDAPIVVLDEATAFADPENEALIQRALRRLTRGKTVLMVAHRLSTVVSADTIAVLEDGRIVERGTHGALLAAGGVYAGMWSEYQTAATWKVGNGHATR